MDKRNRVALIYQYNENWIGGTYYIQNLISAINLLPDQQKPILAIICESESDYEHLCKITRYPYIERRSFHRKLNIIQRIINKASRTIKQGNLIRNFLLHKDIDVVFPGGIEHLFLPTQKFLYWIPDFQEHHLPEFFQKEEIAARAAWQQSIADKGSFIVFSSYDAEKDFNTFYPANKLHKFVMQFAVTHTLKLTGTVQEITQKYNLPAQYHVCSNQFWKHKNQIIVLKAIALLIKENIPVFVAFTGKEHDYRNPDYFESLKNYAQELGIEKQIRFLGFVSREDQLTLIKYSQSVIQPSLFEGWSTVVEDAKSLNAHLIVSDLNVHKEQLTHYEKKVFFQPSSPESLVKAIKESWHKQSFQENNYEADVIKYGQTFVSIIKEIVKY